MKDVMNLKYNLNDLLKFVNNYPENEVNNRLIDFNLTDYKIALIVFLIKNYPYNETFDIISKQLNFTPYQTFETLNYLEQKKYIYNDANGGYVITNKSLKLLTDRNWDHVDISDFQHITDLYNFEDKKVEKTEFKQYDTSFPVWQDLRALKSFFEIPINEPLSDFTRNNYSSYKIITKDKERLIYKPSLHLKKIQQWILKNILNSIPLSENCHSFTAERSIVTNAKAHLQNSNSKMLKIDIQNFFHSIEFNQVIDLFKNIGYSHELSESLAILCTNEDGTPCQGFSTSPQISNIVFLPLDKIIKGICKENNLIYTRYADDLTISGESLLENDIDNYIQCLSAILKKENFRINNKKTKFFKNQTQKRVTGITLNNDHLAVPKKYKRYLEKEIYFIRKFGLTQHMKKTDIIHISNYKGYLYGICGFINQISSDLGYKYKEQLDKIF